MQFNIFKNKNLIQGISDTSFGSMRRDDRNVINFLKSIGVNPPFLKKTVWTQQVFGARVHVCKSEDSGKVIKNADGLISNIPSQILAVITADCVPILLYDLENQVVGALHGSRKSLVGGIIKNAVEKMISQFGTNPKKVLVGIGPHIRICHYWLKKETHRNLRNTKFKGYFVRRGEKVYFDLTKLTLDELGSVGIQKKNIDDCRICTFCSYQKYFSARKKEESPKVYKRRKPVFASFLGVMGELPKT